MSTYGQRLRDKGINVSRAATPTRTRRLPVRKEHNNAWERGTARGPDGLPYLDGDLEPIGVKRFQEEFADKAREREERIAHQRLTADPDQP